MKRRSDEEISAPLYAFDAEVRSQYGCRCGRGRARPALRPRVRSGLYSGSGEPGVRHQRFQKADREKARSTV